MSRRLLSSAFYDLKVAVIPGYSTRGSKECIRTRVDHRFLLDTIGPVPGRGADQAVAQSGYVEAEMFHGHS